jgi:D-glycero-alpha-D-manno-heptose-7-phosphate kinase
VEPVKTSQETVDALRKKLLFFYTGISRNSGRVLKEQKSHINDKIEYLNRLRALAETAKAKLERGDLESFGTMLGESWQMKRTFATGVSNDIIDNYYNSAITAGAAGGKILGAGGGGFFMIYCDEDKQDAVRKALQPLREVQFSFPSEGSKIIFNDRAD